MTGTSSKTGKGEMHLYTVIFEFRGGTYLYQVTERDERSALERWAEELDHKEIEHLGPKSKKDLIEDIKEDGVDAPITGLRNVWKTGILACGHFGLIYVIKTDGCSLT